MLCNAPICTPILKGPRVLDCFSLKVGGKVIGEEGSLLIDGPLRHERVSAKG